jgi:2'-phosphotransferase
VSLFVCDTETQGHSIDDVVDERLLVPISDASAYALVMHGTFMSNWDAIAKQASAPTSHSKSCGLTVRPCVQGLSRMSRRHVHLTTSLPEAGGARSGMRAECDLVVVIDMQTAMDGECVRVCAR